MHEKINLYLSKIEEEKDIRILLACETGSRAWGFPSPDSDFDIRIIYVHKKEWYLSLNEKRDSIDLMFENNDIDITGWDLKKSLMLLRKSNAPLLERLQSPIIYRADDTFLNDIGSVINSQYSRIATIHHYLSMTKRFLFELKQEKEYKLKLFFYALRSATSCKWILEHEEVVPIEFQKVLCKIDISDDLLLRINELIKLKATSSEDYLHEGEIGLINFIDKCVLQSETQKNSLPSSKGKLEELNLLFLNTLNRYDN